MLHADINERLEYLENKLDELDGMLWKLEGNTTANFKVLSADIHRLHQQLKNSPQ